MKHLSGPWGVSGFTLLVGLALLNSAAHGAGSAHSYCSGASPFADEVLLEEINAARVNPHAYAQALRDELSRFHDRIFEAPGQQPLETAEGASALQEAIADLERRAPVPPLRQDAVITLAALHMVEDQGRSGALGHVDSAHATLRQRLENVGVLAHTVQESIAYGPTEPRDAVRELIVDDGVHDRAHRNALLDPTMTRAGAACGRHATWGSIYVIDMAGGNLRSHRER
jgi:uncharacterized protein YkwD